MKFSLSNPVQQNSRAIYRRIVAYFIDMALLLLLVQGFQWGLLVVTGGFPFEMLAALNNGWLIYGWVLLTVSVPIWLYFVLSERSRWQATLGKWLMGLQVTSVAGGKASWRQLLGRTVLKLLPWEIFHLAFMLPIPLMNDPNPAFRPGFVVGYAVLLLYLLVMVQTPRQQSIHDLIMGTVVAKRP
ncbi:RDD family protein [Candidatus Leptofilum sp.]|uniref:RDD family protein n=1 Tax=Candidatus Leptofilum sp. TaxID=3241576 RepID=UPI003B59D632